ncbi:MAG: hypothetical protein ABI647_04180 [Gemmatimonadota bacterium]
MGEHQVIDPTQTSGCVRVPAAAAAGAEYIVDVVSTAPNRTNLGVSGPFYIRTAVPGATTAPQATANAAPAIRGSLHPLSAQGQFDLMLREKERAIAADPRYRAVPRPGPKVAAAPPLVGDQKTFKSCQNLQCSTFVDVAATARFVGTHAAIYMDNSVPQNDTLQAVDYADLGNTFDTYHYPIDVTAFGSESDIDNNQRVIILLTDAVNNLTPDCTNGRVLGYFFGGDLSPGFANSNNGEVFYALVPSPATAQCTAISRSTALNNIKPTLIHEFQHMISYNQHVLVRFGASEETWLNEALSHFAEELGGRIIPNSECPNPPFSSCRSQYISGDIFNSYDYLADTEAEFLIYPTSSNGTLEERGASWYFVRWVLDQFATDTILGTDLTLKLVNTPATGVVNISTATGGDFSTMVPQWLLAAYLDDLPNFTPLSDRIKFKSWGLRAIWLNPANAQAFPNGFPLKPDSTSGAYTHSGTLRGGSGFHLRLIQQANGAAIDVQAVRTSAGEVLDPALQARIGIARVR